MAGPGWPAGWVARFRAWRARSISNQFTVAAVSVALAVATVIGATTFVAVRALVARNIMAGLESEARLTAQKLQLDLDLAVRDLEDLSRNSFVANGLVDSFGRDTYLLPFLKEHRLPSKAGAALVLCDFKGKPVASNLPVPPTLVGAMRGPREVLATASPRADLVNGPAGVQLLVSYPVVFPPTGQAEGAIVLVVDLARLLAEATSFHDRASVALLSVNGMEVGGPGAARPDLPDAVTRRVSLPPPLDGLTVQLTVGTLSEPFAPLRWVAIAYVLIGIATVVTVYRSARSVARRLAAPIEALSREAARVASGGEMEMGGAAEVTDEVGALAAALRDMLGRLRASHEELEARVRERTAELQQREKTLERYAETQAVLLREVNHRVKNNLSAIIGVLHLEEGRASVRHEPAVTGVLHEMEARIRSLATVHALLSGAEWRPVPLRDLCQRILRSSLGEGRGSVPELQIPPSPVRVESGQAHNLALVLNELATNTLKYGRCPGGACRVVVEIGATGRDVVLSYRDQGPGFPPAVLGLEPEGSGTGLQLVRGIVESSLGGSLSLSNDGGAVTTIRFTCAPLPEAGATA